MISTKNNQIIIIISVLLFSFPHSTQGQISTLFHHGDRVHQDSLARIQSYNGTILSMPRFFYGYPYYLISKDSGNTWQEMIPPGIDKSTFDDWEIKYNVINPYSLKLLNDSTILGQEEGIPGTKNVFVLSTNYGRTWTINTKLTNSTSFQYNSGKIYALSYRNINVDFSNGVEIIYNDPILNISYDNGRTWTLLDTINLIDFVFSHAEDRNTVKKILPSDRIRSSQFYIHNDSIWYVNIQTYNNTRDSFMSYRQLDLLFLTTNKGIDWNVTSFEGKGTNSLNESSSVIMRSVIDRSFIQNDTIIFYPLYMSKIGSPEFHKFNFDYYFIRGAFSFWHSVPNLYFTGKYWTDGKKYYEGISNIKNLSFEVSDSVAEKFYNQRLSGLPNDVWYRYDGHLPSISSGITWLGSSGICIFIKNGSSVHRMENHGIP